MNDRPTNRLGGFGLVVIFLCPDGPVLSAFGRCGRGPNGLDPHAVECFKQVIQVGASVWRRKPAADGPPLSGPSQLPRVCPRESKADPVEPAFRQAHGLNALRPMCRIGCFLARWFGGAHRRLCQALAFVAFRRYFHNSSLNRSLGQGPLNLCRAYLGIREREVFEGDSQ